MTNTSLYVKADLENKLRVIHCWTNSCIMAYDTIHETQWWFARIIIDEGYGFIHVGPYTNKNALIQSVYEKVWHKIWTVVDR